MKISEVDGMVQYCNKNKYLSQLLICKEFFFSDFYNFNSSICQIISIDFDTLIND